MLLLFTFISFQSSFEQSEHFQIFMKKKDDKTLTVWQRSVILLIVRLKKIKHLYFFYIKQKSSFKRFLHITTLGVVEFHSKYTVLQIHSSYKNRSRQIESNNIRH